MTEKCIRNSDTPSIFDLLEPLAEKFLKHAGPDIRIGFSRETGGVDLPWLIAILSLSGNPLNRTETNDIPLVRNTQHSSDLVGRLRAHVATYEDDDVVAEAADTIGELVEALDAFARVYRMLPPGYSHQDDEGIRASLPTTWPTWGDLRRAAELVAKHTGEQP